MKKLRIGILAAAMVLAVGTTSAFAAGPGRGLRHVDANGDGVCDNAGQFCRYVDANGDGICGNAGQYCRYVDANGDGSCGRLHSGWRAGRGNGCRW